MKEMAVNIYDKSTSKWFEDGDGEKLVFENEVAAKNYLFTQGFKYEFVKASIEFITVNNNV